MDMQIINEIIKKSDFYDELKDLELDLEVLKVDERKFHIDILGYDFFVESLFMWKLEMPYISEKEMNNILDEEEKYNIGPSFWLRPWS